MRYDPTFFNSWSSCLRASAINHSLGSCSGNFVSIFVSKINTGKTSWLEFTVCHNQWLSWRRRSWRKIKRERKILKSYTLKVCMSKVEYITYSTYENLSRDKVLLCTFIVWEMLLSLLVVIMMKISDFYDIIIGVKFWCCLDVFDGSNKWKFIILYSCIYDIVDNVLRIKEWSSCKWCIGYIDIDTL